MDFGRYLKELRIRRGLSMRELSRRSGVSQAYISQLEKGKRGTPKPEVIFSLYPHLDISYSKLMNAAGYLVKDEEFTEEELEFLQQIEQGASLQELVKFKPTVDGKEVTLSELEFAVNVIRSLREQKEKE
jgi:transcriptional regulator with XRE-family HTH domain